MLIGGCLYSFDVCYVGNAEGYCQIVFVFLHHSILLQCRSVFNEFSYDDIKFRGINVQFVFNFKSYCVECNIPVTDCFGSVS